MNEQNYQNHAQRVPVYIVVILIFLLNLIWASYRLVQHPDVDHALAVLMALALMALWFYARSFALTVQNRIIRLEVRLRLRELLPADLQPRIPDFSLSQLVAMRFASDAELPELAAAVLRDNIRERKAIKQMVKQWQADDLRA